MPIRWNASATILPIRAVIETVAPEPADFRAIFGLETGLPKRSLEGKTVAEVTLGNPEKPLQHTGNSEPEPRWNRKERGGKQAREETPTPPRESASKHPGSPQKWAGGEVGKLEAEISRLRELLEAERQKVKKLQFDLIAASGETAEAKRTLAREKSRR